jgi:hypothetical protein
LNKELAVQAAALVAVVSFVCFAGGYVVAGGITRQVEQYVIGENISVNVKAPGQTEYTSIKLKSGMTALDAVAWVVPIKTDLTWVTTMGPAIKSADDRWLTYLVDGMDPGIGMAAYQLKGGENIELTLM